MRKGELLKDWTVCADTFGAAVREANAANPGWKVVHGE